jgi:ATP/maltotriose-dependent transcriptional regulator MalT
MTIYQATRASMIDQADLLARFSADLAARTAALQGAVVAIRLPRERHLSATLWQPDVVIASEQMIARRLGISLHTVKFHVESLFRKLGVSTRTEARAKARERRLANTIDL